MKVYNAIIIDDEPTARDILESHLSKIDAIKIMATCKNAAEGFSVLSSQSIDLLFLDINMPEVTGLMFAKAIQGKTEIIFTTAYREYAVEGFEVQALDYLLKPISLERLMMAVNKFLISRTTPEITNRAHNFTFFRCDRKMVKVTYETILYIESLGDYLKIHLEKDMIITRETMTYVVEKLPQKLFVRTHRSYIVALSKIESFTNEYIVVEGKSIPISRSYRDMVINRLQSI